MAKKSFKRKHPGDAANAFVRNLLCDISEHFGGISNTQWAETLRYFDGRCAYTGESSDTLVQEHIIPHNQTHCGLHVFGNIVPSTSSANAAKSSGTLEKFMRKEHKFWIDKNVTQSELDDRKEKILLFMEESKYLSFHRELHNKISEEIKRNYLSILSLADKIKMEMLLMLEAEFGSYRKQETISSSIDKIQLAEIDKENMPQQKNILKSVQRWKKKPELMVHKVINLIITSAHEVTKNELLTYISIDCEGKNPKGAIASMQTNKGNSFGHIINVENEIVQIVPEIKEEVYKIWLN